MTDDNKDQLRGKDLLVAYYDVDYEKNPKGSNYWRNRYTFLLTFMSYVRSWGRRIPTAWLVEYKFICWCKMLYLFYIVELPLYS